MAGRILQRGKTQRAFRAFLELDDAADWIRGELRGPLEFFDLTMAGFRVLELLHREGPTFLNVVAAKRLCRRQNAHVVIRRLEERGWVVRELGTLAPAEVEANRIPKAKRGQPRVGRQIGVLRLTPAGEKFIANVFPRNAKLVKALMSVLDGREQETLSQLCRKLREGDVVKYAREMMFVDEEVRNCKKL